MKSSVTWLSEPAIPTPLEGSISLSVPELLEDDRGSERVEQLAQQMHQLADQPAHPFHTHGHGHGHGHGHSHDHRMHRHVHDVQVLSSWIDQIDNDPLDIKKADAEAEVWLEYVVAKSKTYNDCFAELTNQVTVHCPKVAVLQRRVWSGMFTLLDRMTVNYERQFRTAQKLRGKMIRLLQHTRTKLDIYKNETDRLKEVLEEKDTEMMEMRVQLTGLQRQMDSMRAENDNLTVRLEEALRMGNTVQDDETGNTVDFLSEQLDLQLDGMDGERRKALKCLQDQDRLVRHLEMSMLSGQKNKVRVVRHHIGVQTESETVEEHGERPPPEAPPRKPKGSQIPKPFRDLMSSVPKKARVMSVRALRRLILQIYVEKIDNDALHDEAGHQRLAMPQFVSDFLNHKYGLHSLTDNHMTELLLSVRALYSEDGRVRMFDLFCGTVKCFEEDRAILGLEALNFLIDTFKRLRNYKQISKEGVNRDAEGVIEIQRTRAVTTSRDMFEYVAAPLVNALCVRVDSLPPGPSKDLRKISLDSLLGTLLEEWVAERERWEKRLIPYFDKYSQIGSMCDSADGQAVKAIDTSVFSTAITPTVLDAVTQATRPCVDASTLRATTSTPQERRRSMTEATAAAARQLKVLSLEGFTRMMAEIDPLLLPVKLQAMFEETRLALEDALWEKTTGAWKTAKDKDTGMKFVYNEETRESRWTMPDLVRTSVLRLDYPSFLELCFKNKVLMSTADATSALDIETRAAIFIQRRFRAHMQTLKKKRQEANASAKSSRPSSRSAAPSFAASSRRPTTGQSETDAVAAAQAAAGGTLRLAPS